MCLDTLTVSGRHQGVKTLKVPTVACGMGSPCNISWRAVALEMDLLGEFMETKWWNRYKGVKMRLALQMYFASQ